ncbi:MAG: ABC transporter substrate-binding protein [Desulfurococcales archaeon]|nr:ABC transporter substrate-binding protein [Desulfurococcales archaeon]
MNRQLQVAAALIGLLVIVGAVVLLFRQGGSMAEPMLLKASTITVGLSTFDVIEEDPSILNGLGVRIEVIRFQVPPQSIDSILKGDTQLTVIPVELAGVTMLQGGDVYIVALDNTMNQAIIAPRDSDINSPRDLVGRRVAAVVGSGTYALFKSFMKELYGIRVDESGPSDVVVVNVRPGDVIDAIVRGDVDAGVIWDPVVSLAIAKYDMKVVASYEDLWREWGGPGKPPMLVWIARGEVVGDREVLEDVWEAHRRAAEKWNSDKEYTVDLLVRLYNLDPEVAELVWERNQMYTGLCITGELKQAMIKVWELAVKGGYLESMPPADRIVVCP